MGVGVAVGTGVYVGVTVGIWRPRRARAGGVGGSCGVLHLNVGRRVWSAGEMVRIQGRVVKEWGRGFL